MDLTDAIRLDASVSETDAHLRMSAGLLEAATVYREEDSRGSMHTKVMRSASSEDMRSEAQRAIRTREGKDCLENTCRHWWGSRREADISGPWELGAGGY